MKCKLPLFFGISLLSFSCYSQEFLVSQFSKCEPSGWRQYEIEGAKEKARFYSYTAYCFDKKRKMEREIEFKCMGEDGGILFDDCLKSGALKTLKREKTSDHGSYEAGLAVIKHQNIYAKTGGPYKYEECIPGILTTREIGQNAESQRLYTFDTVCKTSLGFVFESKIECIDDSKFPPSYLECIKKKDRLKWKDSGGYDKDDFDPKKMNVNQSDRSIREEKEKNKIQKMDKKIKVQKQ